tara:strand:+ start:80 stop:571 length:492 start_codon:yes stop_codon:yes gene_type:complete
MKEKGVCIVGAVKKAISKVTEETKEDRGPMDLTLLVEQHGKEVWALKEQLFEVSKELTVLRGAKQIVTSLSNELVTMKKRAQEAEGENTIIKGIGNTSPEMKALKERVKELDNSLSIALEINENHQRYNGKLQTRVTDLEEDNKKLAHQVEDLKMNHRRKAGF